MGLVIRNDQMAALSKLLPRVVLPCDIWLRVAVRDYFHRPFIARPYEMAVSGEVLTGKTDPQGLVVARLQRGTKMGTLSVFAVDGVKEPDIWDLEIGEMEPASSRNGAVARLKSLGFLRPGQDMSAPLAFDEAVANFQAWVGLPMTGELDAKTSSLLELACKPPLSSNPAQSGLPKNPEAAAMWAEWKKMLEIDSAPLPEEDD